MKKAVYLLLLIMLMHLLGGCKYLDEENEKKVLYNYAVIHTEKGDIRFRLFWKEAYLTTNHFVKLVEEHFYDGLTFNKVVETEIIMAGKPQGNGTRLSRKRIQVQASKNLKHERGSVGLFREIGRGSSIFYITFYKYPQFDGVHTIFGQVEEGFETMGRIKEGDKIISISLEQSSSDESLNSP